MCVIPWIEMSFYNVTTFRTSTLPVIGNISIGRLSDVPTEGIYNDYEAQPRLRLEYWDTS